MTSFSSDKTLGGLSLIQWLDQKRWQSSGEWDWAKDLNSEETVLAHWLTYVTDRQMPASQVWHQGAPVFRDWAKRYRHQHKFEPHNAFSKKTGFEGDKTSFKSRYPRTDFHAIVKSGTSGYMG